MTFTRGLLILLFIGVLGFTISAVRYEGWNLFSVFFGDLKFATWRGQFNFDFSAYIVLSGVWIAWRHKFSGAGILLAAAAPLGILFFAPYLFITSLRAKGDVRKLLLGEER